MSRRHRRIAAAGSAVAAAGAALLSLSGAAQAQRVSKVDGNRLLESCTGKSPAQIQGCDAYISGVADAVTLLQLDVEKSGSKMEPSDKVCLPASLSGTALKDTVVGWLKAHAPDRGRRAGEIVIHVLRESFPCR